MPRDGELVRKNEEKEGMMDLNLRGEVALVTGAGSPVGFGRAIALKLAREGCDIIVNDVDLDGAEITATGVRALGRKALAIKADVANSTQVTDMVRVAIEQYGKIDILVNNAGVISSSKPFVEKPETEWKREIDIDLYGVLICTKAVLNHMISRKKGKIVNISSGIGKSGMANCTVYCAAKGGVIAFTKALAYEVARLGISVNSVAPGIAATAFQATLSPEIMERTKAAIPLGRITEPDDVANMVAFLASDVATDIVGQTFSVDGGRFMM